LSFSFFFRRETLLAWKALLLFRSWPLPSGPQECLPSPLLFFFVSTSEKKRNDLAKSRRINPFLTFSPPPLELSRASFPSLLSSPPLAGRKTPLYLKVEFFFLSSPPPDTRCSSTSLPWQNGNISFFPSGFRPRSPPPPFLSSQPQPTSGVPPSPLGQQSLLLPPLMEAFSPYFLFSPYLDSASSAITLPPFPS